MKFAAVFVLLAVAVATAKPLAAGEAGPPKHRGRRSWPIPAAGPTMSGDPELIFTFDDGPNLRTTPVVLDLLAAHRIRAVFFLVGEMAAHPKAAPLIRRMMREGHIVANHTMTHPDLCLLKSDDRAAHEIDDGKAAIENAVGYSPVWFRAPYGVRCSRVEALLEQRNLAHFHWDLDPQEWKRERAQYLAEYVKREVGKMTGRNVLLLHDVKKATVQALPKILEWIETENARRATEHKRRIRIIPGHELAIERLPVGLVDWFGRIAASFDAVTAQLAATLP